jgi:tetratricopeptide (TPR) repeat protein
MSEPLVSILVTVRSSVRALRSCLDGAIGQTHPEVQLVVHDLGSTDGTKAVLREYGDAIEVIESADGEAALRIGLDRCRGRIVGFCAPDRELLPGAARRAVEAFASDSPPGAVYGDVIESDVDGFRTTEVRLPAWSFERVLCCEYVPPLAGAFFQRPVLDAALSSNLDASIEEAPLALWLAVGSRAGVRHVGAPLARSCRAPDEMPIRAGRLTRPPADLLEAIESFAASAASPGDPDAAARLHARAWGNAHLWTASWLFHACDRRDEARWHLGRALASDPDPARFVDLVLDGLELHLCSGRPEALLDWVEACTQLGIDSAAMHYARAIALFALGRPEDARAAERRLAGSPHLGAVLERVVATIDALQCVGRVVEAEYALDVLGRAGDELPAVHRALAVILVNLGRHEEGLARMETYLRRAPGDASATAVRDQLQLMICAASEALRSALAQGMPDRSALSIQETLPLVDVVWRNLAQPELAARLTESVRAQLDALLRLFSTAALAHDFTAIATALDARRAALRSRSAGAGADALA